MRGMVLFLGENRCPSVDSCHAPCRPLVIGCQPLNSKVMYESDKVGRIVFEESAERWHGERRRGRRGTVVCDVIHAHARLLAQCTLRLHVLVLSMLKTCTIFFSESAVYKFV